MKNCIGCKWAVWNKTVAGKNHPSGDGECTFAWRMPPLPASMFWMFDKKPVPSGGHINRGEELKEDCTYYMRDV